MESLKQLFTYLVKDMYYAEKQIIKEYAEMANRSEAQPLRQIFEKHRDETEGQVQRLEKVFGHIGAKPSGTTCEAIDGILEEGREIMQDADVADLRDVGMIASAQAIEHYEITRYGTLTAWAKRLGMDEAADLLHQTLEEQKAVDKKLSDLAESTLNKKAA